MQLGTKNKTYSMEGFFPHPFDRNLYMPPFPPHFTTPSLPKYKGKGDLVEHIREFNTKYMEITYDPTYLMILFP